MPGSGEAKFPTAENARKSVVSETRSEGVEHKQILCEVCLLKAQEKPKLGRA
jgi:hypothetical protein